MAPACAVGTIHRQTGGMQDDTSRRCQCSLLRSDSLTGTGTNPELLITPTWLSSAVGTRGRERTLLCPVSRVLLSNAAQWRPLGSWYLPSYTTSPCPGRCEYCLPRLWRRARTITSVGQCRAVSRLSVRELLTSSRLSSECQAYPVSDLRV